MNEITTNNNAYDKLTPQRKALVDIVLNNLENGKGFWEQGWANVGVPVSAATGKMYRGINNLYLSLIAMARGYTDNRWATFNQITERGWSFKKDEEGKSKGKGAGVTIEFYELYDKDTKKPFDKATLDGMPESERDEYMQENVRPMRKYFRVFNGDIIDGIQEREKHTIDPSEKDDRAEKLLRHWNDYEARIMYGGDSAYYKRNTDEIHIPKRERSGTYTSFTVRRFTKLDTARDMSQGSTGICRVRSARESTRLKNYAPSFRRCSWSKMLA